MSNSPLKRLTIEHLRGSVVPFSLPFESRKKLTVLYGENGTGKSTICDAFEFLGNGRVGSLENKGLGKTGKYWQSIGKRAADVSVTLETSSGTCRGTIGKSAVVISPPDSQPKVEILRRSQVLNLVESTAADRYAAISRFIDISGIEESEANLRKQIKNIEQSRDIAVARVGENEAAIRQLWSTSGQTSSDAIDWARVESQRDMSVASEEAAKLRGLGDAYVVLKRLKEQIPGAESEKIGAIEIFGTARREAEECLKNISQDAKEVVGVLEAAKRYLLKTASPSHCPLCESSENVVGLSERVNNRLSLFSAYQSAKQREDTASSAVARADAKVNSLYESIKDAAETFNSKRAGCSDIPGVALFKEAPTSVDALEEWLSSAASSSEQWKLDEAARAEMATFTAALKGLFTSWEENYNTQKNIDIILPVLKNALVIVEDERRKYTDGVLKSIANEVGRLYELVHPGEGLNCISLELDSAKRASLEMGASFCGQQLPPQAYFSDSHLDTLGLCVFLALAGLERPEDTILVLDDVLASVDEPHVDRLIEMLYAETLKFRHCLIATHYRPWKHKLQWGWLKSGQCQFIELTRWTNVNGLSIIRTVPDVERLGMMLKEENPDQQLVCAKAGYILEAALNFLTLLYECPVPRKPEDRYTLGDLLPNISKNLREVLRVYVLKKNADGTLEYHCHNLGPILDEIKRIAMARNVFGCHFKEISFDLLGEEALDFARQVLSLMEILTDPDAGWPKNDKSGEYWSTSGDTRRLHPLRKPA